MSAVIELRQGTDSWHQHRLNHFGASEAAAMLGLSPTMTRNELLRMKHTGLAREFSEWLQRHVLDKGHDVEASARPYIEALIGQDLYPVTRSMGRLSASCDGLTIDDSIAMEHKQWSASLVERMDAGEMPEEHMPQCQQVLMVTGAERLLFVVSDGTPENMRTMWINPDHSWFRRLTDGWAQFERDLAAYVLPDEAAPAPVGKAPETLPALRIEVTGQVTASNLAEFKATALAAIQSVNRSLKTDQDFADADKAVKWCTDVETRLKAAKEHALSQTASIDALFKTIDDISAEARRVRLDLDKLVTRRKTEVKEEAVSKARAALDAHIADLNGELAPMRLQPVTADFAGAIKGLRSISSMQDALDTTLANGKIAADGQARLIRSNVAHFTKSAQGMEFLFSDLGALVHKSPDDFEAVLSGRIRKQLDLVEAQEKQRKADEAARIAAAEQRAREQEAARIAEAQRLAAKQIEDARIAAEMRDREEERAARELASAIETVAPQTPEARAVADLQLEVEVDGHTAAHDQTQAALIERGRVLVDDIIAAEVLRDAVVSNEPATLKLGDICAWLGFSLTGAFVSDRLRIQPAGRDKSAVLFRNSQREDIRMALIAHLRGLV